MKFWLLCFVLLLSVIVQAQEPENGKFQKLSPIVRAWQQNPAPRNEAPRRWAISVTDTTAFEIMLTENAVPATIVGGYAPTNTLFVETSPGALFHQILPAETVLFVDFADRQPQEEAAVSNFDLSANRVNLAHHSFPFVNGARLTVSIKENNFDRRDIDFAQRVALSGAASRFTTNHATIMATIAGGGGNSFYTGKGVAWGCRLTSADFANLFPETPLYYDTLKISVQNHSYGVGIENYYGSDAAAYDDDAAKNPTRLHVFSAGNQGNRTDTLGRYRGLIGYANLTGSFKMAKNILAVGAMDSLGTVPLLSSRGPAYDGRVKPELVAFGLDGSSGAAALVSGTALLLQQAWQLAYRGELPPAALVKAILLNSADDVETPGIDFRSGYGAINTWRALQTVAQGRHFSGEATTVGEIRTFELNVPTNAKRLKLTLAWTDAPAAPNAPKALVNDLDMILLHPASGQVRQPWVLSAFPHPDSLAKLPVRGADHLNNAEQITLEDPLPGKYEIRVQAFALTAGRQSFHVAWQVDTAGHFQWTFPTASDYLFSGRNAILRWETTLPDVLARLEWSPDRGASWRLISDTIRLTQGHARWRVPAATFAEVRFRLIADGQTWYSEDFIISPALSTEVGFLCADSVLLYWPSMPQAAAYRLYTLESAYLTPIATLRDTFFVLDRSVYKSDFYAVAPVLPNGREGLRSATIDVNNRAVSCYLRSFLAELQGEQAVLQLVLGTSHQVRQVHFEKKTQDGFYTIATQSGPSDRFVYSDANLKAGINTYRARVELESGASVYTEPADVYYQGKAGYYVFPNPVGRNQLLRVLSRGGNTLRLALFDNLGRLVLRRNLIAEVETVFLKNFPTGVYYYLIFDGENNIGQGKVLVE